MTSPYSLDNFFRNIHSVNYCQLIIIFHQHHHPSLLPLPPSTLLTTPTKFNFPFLPINCDNSTFFTPYTDQFSFTFAIFTATSLYFLLPNLISKNSLLAISCFSSFFIAHSACCTPYTFQFTFTSPFTLHNSLYIHLPNMVSKNSILAT